MRLTQRFARAPGSALGLGLALALSSHAVLAAPSATASASMSDFRMSAIDMTPDDGIAAGYHFDDNLTISTVGSSIGRNFAELDSSATNNNAAPLYAHVDQVGLSANTHAGSWGDMRAAAYMNANDGADILGLAVSADALQFMTVVVSPHTQFNVGGHTDLSLAESGHGSNGVVSFAETSIGFNGSTEYFGVGSYYPTGGSLSKDFSYSYVNDSDTEQYLFLELHVRGYSTYYEAAAPVPEPGAYAMFGLGALMVGAIARRKRRRERAA